MDSSYGGRLVDWVAQRFKFCLEVVLRPRGNQEICAIASSLVSRATFGWLNHSHRLSKSYERLTRTDEAWVYNHHDPHSVEALDIKQEFPNSF
ncbi:hypothetical protein [Nitrosomonas communis]|uniref:hypothetical protein n=1 Tax=Nitrosomonas communis TaxID=44574 RepID=UPI003D2DFC60